MATTTIKIQDATFAGKILHEIALGFASECVTVRDIISARVTQEVQEYNQKQPEYYRGLIDPTDAEKTINGLKVRNRKPIDAEQQVYVALDAFQRNGFFVLVDNVQAENADAGSPAQRRHRRELRETDTFGGGLSHGMVG